jgi:hypothetical protein
MIIPKYAHATGLAYRLAYNWWELARFPQFPREMSGVSMWGG